MNLVLMNEGLSLQQKHIAFLDRVYLISSGYDQPRYIDWQTRRSGKAGMFPWSTRYFYRPSGSAVSGGSLTVDKFYSIKVVAVDTRFAGPGGVYKVSNPGPASDAVATSGSNLSIEWTIPAHPDTGFEPNGSGGLTESDECRERWIYACVADTADAALVGPWSYAGKLENNTDNAVFTLESFSATTTFPEDDRYPPPNFRMAISAFDRIWGVGGIWHSLGQAQYKNSNESETITGVSIVDEQENVVRYTFDIAPILDFYRGDFLDVSGCDASGNDITEARILRIASDKTWVDVENEDGTAETPSGTPTGTLYQNHIAGDADAAFTDGMANAMFQFDGIGEDGYLIEEVDVDNQVLILSEKYDGGITASTLTNYQVYSDYGLYWSDVRNAHSYPANNYAVIGTRPTGIAASGNYIVIFSEGQIYRISPEAPEQGTYAISSETGCPAPKSIVATGGVVYFWDGTHFSKTDGSNTVPVTMHKADLEVESIDVDYNRNIVGAYDRNRNIIRWMFTVDGEVTNNRGLELNVQNEDVWPVRMWDVNQLWFGPDPDTRKWGLWHAGGNRYTYSAKSFIFRHDAEEWSGALPENSGMAGFVTGVADVASGEITVIPEGNDFVIDTLDGSSTYNAGLPFVLLDALDDWELHGIVKQMTDNGNGSYTVAVHNDWDLTDVKLNDRFLLGCIPMHYGIRWIDFDSPRYPHHVYDISLNLHPLDQAGYLAVDWYTEMSEERVKTELRELDAGTSRVQFNFRMGKPYVIGFALRWYGPGRIRLQHYSLTWATIR